MKDWQLEAMIGADVAADWMSQNEEDPCKDELITASKMLSCATSDIDSAMDWIENAAKVLKDTPMEPKVLSFRDDLMNFYDKLVELRDVYFMGRME